MTDTRVQLLEEENRELRHAVDELSMLNDLASRIGALNNSEEIIHTIVRRSLRAINASQGVIKLVDRRNDADPMRTLIRTGSGEQGTQKFSFDQGLFWWMDAHREPLLINDPRHDERFREMVWDPGIHSLLSVPLMIKSELIAILTLYNKNGKGGFTADDRRLLAIIAAQSAQVIENARLYEEEKQLLEIRRDLQLAADIQAGLQPRNMPHVEGYDLAGASTPALEVGGDYFDLFPLANGQLGFAIADASGKGTAAALFMAVCRTLLRSEATRTIAPSVCVHNVNRALCIGNEQAMFATLVYGILDADSGRITFCNAGHLRPVHQRHDGTVTMIESPGSMALGMMENGEFRDQRLALEKGDRLIFYTDGVTEAENAVGRQFGEDAFLSLLADMPEASSHDTIAHINSTIASYSGGRGVTDDITLIVLSRSRS